MIAPVRKKNPLGPVSVALMVSGPIDIQKIDGMWVRFLTLSHSRESGNLRFQPTV